MTTTNSWSSGSGTGDFLDGTNWSLNIAPAAGQFDVVGFGEPLLQDASVDGFTIDIVSQQTLEAELDITDATLETGMLIEDTNSTNGQSMLLSGQVTNDGTWLFDASLAGVFNGMSLNFIDNTDTLTNNGVITIAKSDGLFVGNGDGGTLVNDGRINVGGTRLFLNSPIVGTGTIAIDDTTLDVTSSISTDQTIAFVDTTSTAAFNPGRLGLDVGGSEGTVDGFVAGDTLDFPQLSFIRTGSGYDAATRELTVVTSNGTLTFHLGGTIPYVDGSFFPGADTSEGFQITTTTVACFVAGTRLLTVSGEVAVQTLAPGDLLVTLSGQARPLQWIGHRHVDCARHPKPEDVWPVRVHAHAFARGMPQRDLLLSPDHAVFVGGALIPVRYLVNGKSIVQEQCDEVTYYHVELPSHEVILAEGLPCESYLDTGNRSTFVDAGRLARLTPAAVLAISPRSTKAPV